MAEKKIETERLQVVISLKTLAYMGLLSEKGSHGSKVSDVARTFIEMGIRSAIERGHITKEDREMVQKREK